MLTPSPSKSSAAGTGVGVGVGVAVGVGVGVAPCAYSVLLAATTLKLSAKNMIKLCFISSPDRLIVGYTSVACRKEIEQDLFRQSRFLRGYQVYRDI
ncbi:MAG: hypothetical protein D6719_11170 [Candidatus Dadabacteria bacterium]|nr:MAG: hypothetical protein D6719_11170 [Candidatus Dadabacteria bacterium]